MSKLGVYAESTSESDARRSETPLERLDRKLEEVTGELRVIVTGAQVLFALLLVVAFSSGFSRMRRSGRVTGSDRADGQGVLPELQQVVGGGDQAPLGPAEGCPTPSSTPVRVGGHASQSRAAPEIGCPVLPKCSRVRRKECPGPAYSMHGRASFCTFAGDLLGFCPSLTALHRGSFSRGGRI